MVQVLILGSGFAGLGAAVEAQRRGLSSVVLEAESAAGGLVRSASIAGARFDRYGPKIIVARESAGELVDLLGANACTHVLHEQVYLRSRGLYTFPVQRHLIELEPAERAEILAEILHSRSNGRDPASYENWLLASFGRRLCELVLFPYEEKKWQIPLSEMDYRWALNRPGAIDFDEIVRGSRTHLPAWRTYHYPREGSMAALVELLVERAGPIHYSTKVTGIDLARRTVLAGGREFHYDELVSTIPLDQFVRLADGFDPAVRELAEESLQWLGMRVYNLVFDGTIETSADAVYFPDPALDFRRVAILNNLCPPIAGSDRTPISVEVPVRNPRGDGAGVETIVAQLRTVPAFAMLGNLLGSDVVDIPEAYPLQRDNLDATVRRITQICRPQGVHHCGRAGTFAYCDMDVAYQQGKRAISAIAAPGSADLV